MKRLTFLQIQSFVLIFLPFSVVAQVGDICSNSYTINLKDPLTFPCDYQQISTSGLDFSTLSNNTALGANPSCNYGSSNHDLWLKVQIPSNSDGFNLSINDVPGSGNDYQNFSAALYTGTSCSNLTYVTCQKGSAANYFRYFDGILPSSTVYVRVYSDNSPSGTYIDRFYIQMAAINTLGSNDACTNAKALIANTYCNNTATGKNEPQPKAPNNISGTGSACIGFGSYENNQWYAFSVDAATIQPVVVSLTGINCTGTNQILQAALWKSTTYNCSNWANGSNLTSVASANDGDLIACSLGTGALNISKNLPVGNYWFTVDGSRGSFCNYTVNTSPALLPIKILEFSAIPSENQTELYWTCLQVYDVQEFVFEYSATGYDFYEVGRLSPSPNRGISSFKFLDRSVGNRTSENYYRIKTIEKSGEISISKTIQVKSILNEPSLDFISIDKNGASINLLSTFKDEVIATIDIFNASGQQILAKETSLHFGIQGIPIPIQGISNGFYSLVIQTQNVIKSQKLVFYE